MSDLTDFVGRYMDFVVGGVAFFVAIAVFYRRFIAPSLRRLEAMSVIISAQMTANGGGSLVDKVARIPHIEQAVENNHQSAEQHWRHLAEGIEKLTKRVEKVEIGKEAP